MFDQLGIFVSQYYPQFLQGALVSLQIAVCSSTIGFILGTILGFLQTSHSKILKVLVTFYVTIIRGIPMLIQITFMKYVVFQAIYPQASVIYIAICAIGLNSGAYLCEVIRSGIQSVNLGQIEAAKTLGFTKMQIRRYIIFPQAIRAILPALGNELITLVKDSSLASTIGVAELFKSGSNIRNQTYDTFTVYLIMGCLYLIMTTSISFVINKLEKRLNKNYKN